MLVGVHQRHQPPEDTKTQYGRVRLTRPFVSGTLTPRPLIPLVSNACQSSWDADMIPYVSLKPEPSAAQRGEWDRHMEELGSFLADSHPETRVILWHEPENDLTSTEFVDMFNICAGSIRVGSGGRVNTVYSALSFRWWIGFGLDPGEWLDDLHEVDEFAIDVYSGRSFPDGQILPEHVAFSRWLDSLNVHRGHDTPWAVTERGFQNHESRAETIRREAVWLANSNCSAYIYWDSPGAENDHGWRVANVADQNALQYLVDKLHSSSDDLPPDDDPYQRGYDHGYEDGVTDGYIDGISVGKRDAYNDVLQFVEDQISDLGDV